VLWTTMAGTPIDSQAGTRTTQEQTVSQLSLSLYRVLYIVLLSGHSRQRDQLNAVALICSFVRLSVCPSVCLSV